MVVCFQRSYWRGSMFDSAGFANGIRRLNENPSRYLERGLNVEKSLASCHLNKQCLINGLEAEVNERCL
jgi:hypothetical protein